MQINFRNFYQIKAIILMLSKILLSIFLLLNFKLAFAATDLSDKPLISNDSTGNVALALSVEYPTALSSAYKNETYVPTDTYLGYFDAEKCYSYQAQSSLINGLLYNTGVDNAGKVLPAKTRDAHWVIKSAPAGVTGATFILLDQAAAAPERDTVSAALAENSAGYVPAGNYAYQSNSFTIPSTLSPQNIEVSFDLWTDDSLVDLQINGISTGIKAASTYYSSARVTIPAGSFKQATNSLTIIVGNGGGLTKLRISQMTVKNNPQLDYFTPIATAINHTCTRLWSGNYLNWATSPALDSFRKALTGGYRAIDQADLTVLEKAYATGEQGAGLAPDKWLENATDITNSTPYSASTLGIRTYGLGNQFYITSAGDTGTPSGLMDGAKFLATSPLTNVYAFKARVQVCKAGYLESNCTLYPNAKYKPTGLVQKNASKLRFAAFGYLNDSTHRDGAVLRARMAFVGPGSSAPEWDVKTGIFNPNPNASDATASLVNNSGVINYLNKFGGLSGYKTYDPVSELYYTVGRYFRNKGNVPEYTSITGLPNTAKDGFPAISTWDDPIKSNCDTNYIIGIGDINSWQDGNLPGSLIKTNEPATPSTVTNDYKSNGLSDILTNYTDVATSSAKVAALEGLGSSIPRGQGDINRGTSMYMTGLAYDLHTRDFRPDLSGKQIITTYWLDVLEASRPKNQFWLAAKYGGFKVPSSYDPYSASASLQTSDWDEDQNGSPDNYFVADKPSAIYQGLNTTFDKIVKSLEGSSTGFEISSPIVKADDISFTAKYSTKNWTGSVTANSISIGNGSISASTQKWTTNDTLEKQGWQNRFIATSNCGAANASTGEKTCTGVSFNYDNLNVASQTAISTLNDGKSVVDFLRGDRSKQNSNGGVFRNRDYLLGDIINSKILAVTAPRFPYGDATNSGYSTFKNAKANRPTVAYVGANDGMLHAFNEQDGKELFAYVPNALFNGPNNTPAIDGLAALTNSNYTHHAYVDSSPAQYDVQFADGSWHSLLMGGLGKGGKSYYALDVTDPATLSNEANLAAAVKWEFTHKDLGYSYGKPLAIKSDGKWVVIIASGYNNADGKGYFFILDAQTGKLLNKISTGVGSATSDAGLAHVTAFVNSRQAFSADAAYAGDLLGNVWRLDLAGVSIAGYTKTPTKIATLKDANNIAQPITVSPVVEYDRALAKRVVFIGTGRLLANTDISNNNIQSFYAIYDGNKYAFDASLANVTRASLVDQTSKTAAIAVSSSTMGYYIDFTPGYAVNVPIASSAGAVFFVANKLGDGTNTCGVSASYSYREYALKYGTGKSLLSSAFYLGTGYVNGIVPYQVDGEINLNLGTGLDSAGGTGSSVNIKVDNPNSGGGNGSIQQLNWRAIPIQN